MRIIPVRPFNFGNSQPLKPLTDDKTTDKDKKQEPIIEKPKPEEKDTFVKTTKKK